jgi:hypothetical protein
MFYLDWRDFMFGSFIDGIRNLIHYFPTIWKDRDWDQWYILKLLKVKLDKMEKYIRNYSIGIESENDANAIKYVINILNRIINDVYLEEALKPFYEKYPDYEWKFESEPCEDNPKLSRLINNDTPEQKELMYKCFKKSDELENEDYNKLFDFLKNNIRNWWD